MSQLPTLGPTDKSRAPTGWYSTPSRSDCTTQLTPKKAKWIKELPNALWGLRTQPTKPTGHSPYFLVYGSEAILPTDVMWESPAVEQYDEGISEDSRRVDIDGLKEACRASLV
jgi:hypothetical protein